MGNESFDLSSLLPMLGAYAVFVAVVYVYIAAVLMVIARKTGTPNGWMAWVPILNIVLMCRIAGKSAGWVFLMLIPLVNFVVLAVIWMGIAKARGKSPALGLLIVVPLANLVMPLMLAMGPATTGQPGPKQFAYSVPPLSVCPACGRTECVADSFCGYTGQRIAGANPAPVYPPVAQAAPAKSGAGGLAAVVVGLLLLAGVGFFAWGLIFPNRPGAARTGDRPVRQAGRLTEFPVDTAANPVRPTAVSTRSLRPGRDGRPASGPPASSLPAGLTAGTLGRVGSTVTSATYRGGPQDPPVDVHVIDKYPGTGPQSETIVQASSNGSVANTTQIRVESPTGQVYTGYKVSGPQGVTITLDKASGDILIIIHANDPGAQATAERLAGNVGNGNGLLDDPEVGPAIEQEAASLPAGFDLIESSTYAGANLEGSFEQMKREANVNLGPEATALVEKIRGLLPGSIVSSRYQDGGRSEFRTVMGSYGGSLKAWTVWMILRGTAGASSSASIPMRGGEAITIRDGGKEYVMFRRGGCLGMVEAPSGMSARSVQLAEAVVPQ